MAERLTYNGIEYEIRETTPTERTFVVTRMNVEGTSRVPLLRRVRFELFKTSGKWKYGGEAYVHQDDYYLDADGSRRLLADIDATQREVLKGTLYEYRVFVGVPDYDHEPGRFPSLIRLIDAWELKPKAKTFKPVPGDE